MFQYIFQVANAVTFDICSKYHISYKFIPDVGNQ